MKYSLLWVYLVAEKSDLIRLINRLIEPTYGSIYIEGHDIAKMNQDELRQVRRHSVNMVFQKFATFPRIKLFLKIRSMG